MRTFFFRYGPSKFSNRQFLTLRKNTKLAVFRLNVLETNFFTKGTHIQLDCVYFLAQTPFEYSELKGASIQECYSLILPKMACNTHFTHFMGPACNAKHTYARVVCPTLPLTPTLVKSISTEVRPKNWPEPLFGCVQLRQRVWGWIISSSSLASEARVLAFG